MGSKPWSMPVRMADRRFTTCTSMSSAALGPGASCRS